MDLIDNMPFFFLFFFFFPFDFVFRSFFFLSSSEAYNFTAIKQNTGHARLQEMAQIFNYMQYIHTHI